MRIAALAGGVGAGKLLAGLQRAVPDPRALTAIVNTGDDATIYGLRVSPDLDIVTYWLAGAVDESKGWGLRGDTFHLLAALGGLGVETWFRLGDRDFATCLYRTQRLSDGATLTTVTDELRAAFGLLPRILPMSDDPAPTLLRASDGRVLEFQEYFVKEQARPEIREVVTADAKPAPGVIESIAQADLVVACPSNPLLSLRPILALPGVREELRDHARVVAVTPIIRGRALKGPADRLLDGVGVGSRASSVAALYSDFCDVFVVDASDHDEIPLIERRGVRPVPLDTVMTDGAASERLARSLLSL